MSAAVAAEALLAMRLLLQLLYMVSACYWALAIL